MKKRYLIAFGLFFTFNVALALVTGTLLPVSDGSNTAFTPSTGTSHFALVDEATCNTTDYNSTNTVGSRDSYNVSLSSIPNGSVVTAISITPCASRNSSGGGSSTMNVFYKLDGVSSSDSGAYALSGTNPTTLASTNFAGLGTVKSSGTTLEIGAVYSSGTKGVKLSRIGTVVTYIALPAPTNVGSVADATSTDAINLSWSDTSYEENFVIERKNVTASTTYATIATTTINSTSYQDTGLSSGNTYMYRLRSYAGGGYSAYSSTTQTTR